MVSELLLPRRARVLFLDDMEDRVSRFRARLTQIGHAERVDVARTADEAVDALRSQSYYDWVFLDHDLEPEHYESDAYDRGTGLQVARHLNGLLEQFRHDAEKLLGYTPSEGSLHDPVVVVHSMNPVGAARMLDAMPLVRARVHVPFHRLLPLLRVGA
jgi:CheY-like chemotaxis protein